MAKVVEKRAQHPDRTLVICDFSPPRGADSQLLEPAGGLDADFVCVAYNPGRSTRVSSFAAAHWIRSNFGKDVVFNLATRDMNKVAIQSLLLGAQLMGLENLVVVKGDEFSERDRTLLRDVSDFRPTELVRSIAEMNAGVDFKGLKLRSPTDFCVGASIDPARGLEREVALTRRKVEAGAQFFISQPTFGADGPGALMAGYADSYGEELSAPVFHGVQVMTEDSLVFGDVPEWVTDDLAKGRSGADIAVQTIHEFEDAGFRSIYLVPPVMKGGRRDYDAAQEVLEAIRT